MSIRVGKTAAARAFPVAAKEALGNAQLRRNVYHATDVIRNKRALRVDEMPDWQQLRETASEIKQHTLAHLDFYLEEFTRNCERAGGKVHWARDADEANAIAVKTIREFAGEGAQEVIKVKTMTSDEVQMNVALEAADITPIETDLADMIVQLGHDEPSHIVVPALHKNRVEIRDIFRREMNLPELTEQPEELAAAARRYLRERMLLDLAACIAKLLPVRHLFHAQRAFVADDIRRVMHVAAKLVILECGLGGDREVRCFRGLADDNAHTAPPVSASISARCIVRTCEPER
jgi:L-lactate dehydrogenase complex protein LldF